MNAFGHLRSKLANCVADFYFSTVRNEYVNAMLVPEGGQVPMPVKTSLLRESLMI
jgi:hypothetical protein